MNKTKSIRVRLTDDELAHAEAASLNYLAHIIKVD